LKRKKLITSVLSSPITIRVSGNSEMVAASAPAIANIQIPTIASTRRLKVELFANR
jgi:hypothetical protein